MRRRLWEEEVVHLLAAAAGSLGVKGLGDYATPAERLEDHLEAAGGSRERDAQERRLRALALGDGDVVTDAG